MLEGIYLVLNLVIFALAVWYLLCITYYFNEHNGNRIRRIKVQILFFSIQFVLFISETIVTSILGQSQLIILYIFGIIITAVYTILGFFALKEAKKNALNAQSANEDVIDLNCEKMQDDETEKDEP